MLFGRKLAILLTVAFAAALLVVFAVSASAADEPATIGEEAQTAYKLANDTDPHLPLPASEQAKVAEKDKALAGSIAKRAKTSVASAILKAAAAFPTTSGILMNQIPQQRSYWCGPATVQEALQQLGVWLSQARLATELGTTSAGTAWSGGPTRSGRPIPDVLNAHQSKNYFVPVDVPIGYSGYLAGYKSRLMNNIAYVRAPLIGDAYQVPGGYHLFGHPGGAQIFHWFDIRGYTQSGARTMYEDTVAGAASIAWSGGVPRYSTIDSWKLLSIMSGRGYIW